VLLIAGIALTATALALHAAVGTTDFFVQTAAFLVGINMFVAGLTTGGR
jgi:hypothetical protein